MCESLTVNVLRLVGGEITNSKLAVRSLGSAITARQIVDDQSSDLVARNVLQVFLDDGDTGHGVTEYSSVCCIKTFLEKSLHPQEGSNIGNLESLSSQGRITDGRSSCNDLFGVLLVGIDGAAGEGVPGESDGSSTGGGSSASCDGTLFDRAGGGESASDGRSHQCGVDTLHVVDCE